MTDLTQALSELRRLKPGDEIDAEFVSTILDAARTGDLIPRADADLAVALMVERADVDAALDAMEANLRSVGASTIAWRTEMPQDDQDKLRSCVLAGIAAALVPAYALAELQALRDERDKWWFGIALDNKHRAEAAEQIATERLDHIVAAEAKLATLRAQVERLTDALKQTARFLDDDYPETALEIARAEGAAP